MAEYEYDTAGAIEPIAGWLTHRSAAGWEFCGIYAGPRGQEFIFRRLPAEAAAPEAPALAEADAEGDDRDYCGLQADGFVCYRPPGHGGEHKTVDLKLRSRREIEKVVEDELAAVRSDRDKWIATASTAITSRDAVITRLTDERDAANKRATICEAVLRAIQTVEELNDRDTESLLARAQGQPTVREQHDAALAEVEVLRAELAALKGNGDGD